MQRAEREVVHLDPDRALPVVLALPELRVRRGEAAEPVWGPEVRRVAEEVEDRAEVWGVCGEQREQEGEEREVALVADVVGFVCVGRVLVCACGRSTEHGPSSFTPTSQYIWFSSFQ